MLDGVRRPFRTVGILPRGERGAHGAAHRQGGQLLGDELLHLVHNALQAVPCLAVLIEDGQVERQARRKAVSRKLIRDRGIPMVSVKRVPDSYNVSHVIPKGALRHMRTI